MVWPANHDNLGRTIEVILSARMFCVKSCMQQDFDLKQIDIYVISLFFLVILKVSFFIYDLSLLFIY